MKIKIRTRGDDYFLKLLLILNNIPPFDRLRPKELQLYAHLLSVNHKYRNIPVKERNSLIFSYDTKIEIANKMDLKMSGVNNILSRLRVLHVIEGESLLPKYMLGKVDSVTFNFEEED